MTDADRPKSFRSHEGRVGGVRLVGLWIPWQAVVGVIAIVVGLTAFAVKSPRGGDEVSFRAASTDELTTTTSELVVETTTSLPESTTTVAETTTTVAKTSITAPATTTTAAPTTTVPTTTTTVIPPGSDEIVIHAGSSQGNGGCNNANGDWEYIATGCSGEPTMIFTYDPRRYPARAEAKLDLALTLMNPDMTYCFRVINLETKIPAAGSERCWVSNVQPQQEPYGPIHPHNINETYGPVQFDPKMAKYAPQVKLTRTSDGSPCNRESPCMGSLEQAKVFIEW